MGKGGLKINFDFVPMPREAFDPENPLREAGLRLLAYILKHTRFGEAFPEVSYDELLHGLVGVKGRLDRGCGLSRNGIKNGQEELEARGWLEANNTSTDRSRPRWRYRLRLSESQLSPNDSAVSASDSGSNRQVVSDGDSAVSPSESATVTKCEVPAPNDKLNKEEESTKYLDKVLERTGRKQPAPASQLALSPNVAAIAEDRRAQRLKELMGRIGDFWRQAEARMDSENKPRMLFTVVRLSAKSCGLEYDQVKRYLLDHPGWCDWPYLNDLDSQQEIDFPAPAKPAARWDEAAYVAAQKGDVSAPAQQLFFSFREFLRGQLGESEYRRLVQPLKFCCLTATELHVLCPEGWNGNGEKLRQQISAWLPERLQGIKFLTAELNHRGHEGTQRKTGSE